MIWKKIWKRFRKDLEKIFEKDSLGSREDALTTSTVDKATKIIPCIDSREHAHQSSGSKDDANNVVTKRKEKKIHHLEESDPYSLI